MKLVAIHQPNFFPWLGYFDKFARANVFVFLDHVQFPKTGGGTWTNRVKLLINGTATWCTAPVERTFHGVRPISEMVFDAHIDWRGRLLKTVKAAYGRAPCFREAMALLEPLIENPSDRVADFNVAAVVQIAAALGIDTSKIRRSTEMQPWGNATEMLISVTKEAGGTGYLCGGGAAGYQDDPQFAAAGLALVYQDFRHPVYRQHGSSEFVPGLSVIDPLMNVGVRGTARLVGVACD